MKKIAQALIATALTGITLFCSAAAFASDSLWLLCKGAGFTQDGSSSSGTRDPIALTLFDQRYKVSERLDTIKLLFGARSFVGRVVSLEMENDTPTPAKTVELKENNVVIFNGDISVALTDDDAKIHLKGTVRPGFDPASAMVPYSADLLCQHVE